MRRLVGVAVAVALSKRKNLFLGQLSGDGGVTKDAFKWGNSALANVSMTLDGCGKAKGETTSDPEDRGAR